MVKLIINEEKEITEEQKTKLIKLLNEEEIKQKEEIGASRYHDTLTYSRLPILVQIIIGGVVYDLSKNTFKKIKHKIDEILNDNVKLNGKKKEKK